MSLSNYSQVLLRCADNLVSHSPLLVNLTADDFIEHLSQLNPDASISCFNSHYGEYLALEKRYGNKVNHFYGACYQEDQKHDLVIIAFPKSKQELAFTLAMLAQVIEDNGQILFIGEKNGGIKSASKLSADYVEHCQKIDSARHCMLFAATFNNQRTPFNLDDWFHYYTIKYAENELTIAALPGVFSQGKLDKGSAVLLNHLPENITGNLLDFGCGAGVIAACAAVKNPELKLTLADVNALALKSSEKTLSVNGLSGSCIATDSLSNIDGNYELVLTNPPFHQGIKTHYAATESFLAGIRKHLASTGEIRVVANSFLQYQPIMEDKIGPTSKLVQEKGFTVYQSRKS